MIPLGRCGRLARWVSTRCERCFGCRHGSFGALSAPRGRFTLVRGGGAAAAGLNRTVLARRFGMFVRMLTTRLENRAGMLRALPAAYATAAFSLSRHPMRL